MRVTAKCNKLAYLEVIIDGILVHPSLLPGSQCGPNHENPGWFSLVDSISNRTISKLNMQSVDESMRCESCKQFISDSHELSGSPVTELFCLSASMDV